MPLACFVWITLGLTCLWVCDRWTSTNWLDDLTVGDVLLFMLAGAPFLPCVLTWLLWRARIPRQRVGGALKPHYLVEAEREVETWLKSDDY